MCIRKSAFAILFLTLFFFRGISALLYNNPPAHCHPPKLRTPTQVQIFSFKQLKPKCSGNIQHPMIAPETAALDNRSPRQNAALLRCMLPSSFGCFPWETSRCFFLKALLLCQTNKVLERVWLLHAAVRRDRFDSITVCYWPRGNVP